MATLSLLPLVSATSSVQPCLPTEQYEELYDGDIIIGGNTQQTTLEDTQHETERIEVFLTVPTEESQETAAGSSCVASLPSQVPGNDTDIYTAFILSLFRR